MSESITFKPGFELTFKSVVTVRAKLDKMLKEQVHDRFRLDLGGVTLCDSAGLALLIEIRKWCQRNNRIFEVAGISPKIQSLAEFCGVDRIFVS